MSLRALAEAGGLALRWKDVHGQWHEVADDTLQSVLGALGLPAGNEGEVAESLQSLQHPARLPPLMTGEASGTLTIPVPAGPYELLLESGETLAGMAWGDTKATVPLPAEPGYHRLRIAEAEMVVAVAPARCWTVADAAPGRPWGLAAQLYSLRRAGDGGLGDFAGLADFVHAAARHGAAAVAISPVHAQFSATADRFSPYSPSSRTLLNVLHAGLDLSGAEAERLEALDLVDWPAATRLRFHRMDAAFSEAEQGGPLWDEFQTFRAAEGGGLEGHARFEALHAAMTRDGGPWHWRDWPAGLSDASSDAVSRFAAEQAREVTRHAYYQFLADRSLGAAQRAAKQAGMSIGLISDLAVGVDSGGSQCWARPDETLLGLNVGAPPDLLNTRGQSWGLAAFSPRGLQLHGFGVFIDMLRAAMRHAGGVRIDHAMGLARLWVIPDGQSAADGVYLHFPVDDMLRLIRLESQRHHAIVLGEDLGTLPDGFQGRISSAGMLGMRVLWFERAQDQGFTAPSGWDHGAVSMTSTHDLPTVAGWWSGRDTDWRRELGHLDGADVQREQAGRAHDRDLLWSAMQASGAAEGDAPPPGGPGRAVDAAVKHVGAAACALTIIPLEDVLGLQEQPNLPGTLDEHPNWRRRMHGPAAALLDRPDVTARLHALDVTRKR